MPYINNSCSLKELDYIAVSNCVSAPSSSNSAGSTLSVSCVRLTPEHVVNVVAPGWCGTSQRSRRMPSRLTCRCSCVICVSLSQTMHSSLRTAYRGRDCPANMSSQGLGWLPSSAGRFVAPGWNGGYFGFFAKHLSVQKCTYLVCFGLFVEENKLSIERWGLKVHISDKLSGAWQSYFRVTCRILNHSKGAGTV